jgi:hypothetical protein
MDAVYVRIRQRAHEIISRHPRPDFYQECIQANDLSKQLFTSNRIISQLLEFVSEHIENDFGHGIDHATKVSLDAGALLIIECNEVGRPFSEIERKVLTVQCAGLLHDIMRKEQNHAIKGAEFARKTLRIYSLTLQEIDEACFAIQNHEAFKKRRQIATGSNTLISDCLYDADKFRWGPDNFLNTIWDMVSFYQTPLIKFIEYYPRGMEGLYRIKKTFRTDTGKKYGPQFIEIGITIGEELLEFILKEFKDLQT